MKPGRYDLPIIWRGSNYFGGNFTWLNANGEPVNLDGWIPRARSLNIDFSPQITDLAGAVTTITFTKDQTANLKLGIEWWDWVWERTGGGANAIRTVPFLRGIVEVRDPATTTGSEQPFNG